MDRRLLYERMEATLFAWWAGLARACPPARLVHLPGITVALFPDPAQREVLNNAVASRSAQPAAADLADLAALYRDCDVPRWQLWVHQEERATAALAAAAGLVVVESTMTMALDLAAADLGDPAPLPVVGDPGPEDVRGIVHDVESTLPMLRACGASLYALRLEGRPACCLASSIHRGDCGIFMLETAEPFRRRGLASALLRHALREARSGGCATASLQSTPVAERLYAAAGFAPMGRYVEWQHREAA